LDDLADEFDNCVLLANAVLDTLARLVGTYLSIDLRRSADWSLRNRRWQKEVGKAGEPGAAIRSYVEQRRADIELSVQLRDHAIHRERMRSLTVQNQRDPAVARLALRGTLLSWIRERLVATGQDPTHWGVGKSHAAAQVPVAARGRSAITHYTIDEPEWAELDPFPFAVRLIANTMAIVDGVMPLLRVEQDSRLPKEWQHMLEAPLAPGFPFRTQDAQLAVLLSPLSGIVDHARPTIDAWSADRHT